MFRKFLWVCIVLLGAASVLGCQSLGGRPVGCYNGSCGYAPTTYPTAEGIIR